MLLWGLRRGIYRRKNEPHPWSAFGLETSQYFFELFWVLSSLAECSCSPQSSGDVVFISSTPLASSSTSSGMSIITQSGDCIWKKNRMEFVCGGFSRKGIPSSHQKLSMVFRGECGECVHRCSKDVVLETKWREENDELSVFDPETQRRTSSLPWPLCLPWGLPGPQLVLLNGAEGSL